MRSVIVVLLCLISFLVGLRVSGSVGKVAPYLVGGDSAEVPANPAEMPPVDPNAPAPNPAEMPAVAAVPATSAPVAAPAAQPAVSGTPAQPAAVATAPAPAEVPAQNKDKNPPVKKEKDSKKKK